MNASHKYVFTKDAHYMTGTQAVNFTGTRILTTKPVSVYFGDGHVQLNTPVSSWMILYYDTQCNAQ